MLSYVSRWPDKLLGANNLKVWSTVKIRGTRVPQNAIVPVGRPRPYSIIIQNMRFIPKASLRASSQITTSSYILERHLWVTIPSNLKALSLGSYLGLALRTNWLYYCRYIEKGWPYVCTDTQRTQNMCMTLYNVGPTSKTLGWQCINAIQMFCVCWAGGLSLNIVHFSTLYIWPPQPRFQSHMKTDNTNRLAAPENLYIYTRFQGNSEKKLKKTLVARWRPFWLSVESWNSNQIISILMGNFT